MTKLHPSFKDGKNLRQIMADFDQDQYNRLQKALGADLAKKENVTRLRLQRSLEDFGDWRKQDRHKK